MDPYRIIEKREAVAYKMKLPAALGGVHDVFHVSQLNECLRVPTEETPLETLDVQEVRSESWPSEKQYNKTNRIKSGSARNELGTICK